METWRIIILTMLSPLIVFGAIGNIISLITWSRGRQRNTSTAKYLIALAVADSFTLTTAATELWINISLEYDIRILSAWTCKLITYLVYVCPALSSWIVVCIAVERALCLWVPHKIRILCTPVRAKVIIVLTCSALMVFYLPLVIQMHLVERSNSATVSVNGNLSNLSTPAVDVSVSTCKFSPDSIYYSILPMFDLFVLSIVPSAVLILSNCAVLSKLLLRRRSNTFIISNSTASEARTQRLLNSMTIRAIVLSISFLVCTLPTTVYSLYLSVKWATYSWKNAATLSLLLYVNNGINFILYCATGSGFRRELRNLFCRKRIQTTYLTELYTS